MRAQICNDRLEDKRQRFQTAGKITPGFPLPSPWIMKFLIVYWCFHRLFSSYGTRTIPVIYENPRFSGGWHVVNRMDLFENIRKCRTGSSPFHLSTSERRPDNYYAIQSHFNLALLVCVLSFFDSFNEQQLLHVAVHPHLIG